MKKLLNVLLILAVLFTNLVPTTVLAATNRNTGKNGSITINNAVENETYDIYRIFLVNSYDTEKEIASYAVEEGWLEFVEDSEYFTLTDSVIDGATQKVVIESTLTDSDIEDFAKAALAYAKTNGIAPVKSIDATSSVVSASNLPLGYYLLGTSVGTLCSLDTTKPNAVINEKNTITPDDTKSIVEDNGELTSSNTAKIGDVVEYEIRVNGITNKKNVLVSDTMSKGLTFNNNVVVYEIVNEKEVELTSGITYTANGNSFTVKFDDSKLEGNTNNYVIRYTATLNKDAVIAGDNTNEFKVTYGNNQTIDGTQSVTTKTYEMTLEKVDTEGNDLTGAIFTLKQLSSDTNNSMNQQILVVPTAYDESGAVTAYRVAMANEEGATDSIVAGTVTISGLENGTYELTETSAPEGYNKLGAPIEFTIEGANMEENFEVVNTSGMILPSTGGMGTVLFMTVGSIMALGFGVNLVTKARMRKIED